MNQSLLECPAFANQTFTEIPDFFNLPTPQVVYCGPLVNFAYADTVLATALLASWHWFLVELGSATQAAIYFNDPDTPKRIAARAAAILDEFAEDKLYPVRNPDSEKSIMLRSTGRNLGQLLLSRGLPSWPVGNVCVGLPLSGNQPTQTLLAMFAALPAAIRYLRIKSYPAPWFQDNVFAKSYGALRGIFDDAAVIETEATLQRKIHWIVCESTAKDTAAAVYGQCIESGTPLFVARPGDVPSEYAIQAWPEAFAMPPRWTPDDERQKRKARYVRQKDLR